MVKQTVDPRKPKEGETRDEYRARRQKEIEKAKKPMTYAQQREYQKKEMRRKAKATAESKTGTDKLNYKKWYIDHLEQEHVEKANRAMNLAKKAKEKGQSEKAEKYKRIEEEHRRKSELQRLRKLPLEREIQARELGKEQQN